MADDTIVGKTILQLDPLTGVIDRANSYLELHVVGRGASQKLALDSLLLRGLSAKEVVQLTHPEIVSDAQFISFITGPAGIKGADGKDGKNGVDGAAGTNGTNGADGLAGKDGKDGVDGVAGTNGIDGVNGTDGAAGKDGANGTNGVDGAVGPKGEDGVDGADGTAGQSAFQLAVAHGFAGTEAEWLLTLIGPRGVKGDDGAAGKSAYQLAQDGGFIGSGVEWLASLVGARGPAGTDGAAGKDGKDGVLGGDGKSAYDLAVDEGFVGSIQEWILSLTGPAGKDGTNGVDGKDGAAGKDGIIGKDGTNGVDGAYGLSAYELAVIGGYVGEEADWIASLVGAVGPAGKDGINGTNGTDGVDGEIGPEGPIGPDGKSAYEVAVAQGYVGDVTAWLATLKGLQGNIGPKGENAHVGTLVGVLAIPSELPPVAGYVNTDYFIVGTHIYMANDGEWVDLGNFQGVAGKDGSGITVLGELSNVAYLPTTGERNGDAWLIGTVMYVWNGASWQLQGQSGLQGPEGKQGPVGKSALEQIKEINPSVTTIEQMREYLRGLQGLKGDTGEPALSYITDGHVDSSVDLPVAGAPGHGYVVGTVLGSYDYWIWLDGAWFNLGNNVGPTGPQGQKGDVGPQGQQGRALSALGYLSSSSELPTSASVGDTYLVKGGTEANPTVNMYIFTEYASPFPNAWRMMGNLLGPQGPAGARGPTGQPVNAKGERASVEDLPTTGNVIGDGYEVGGYIYVYGDAGFERMGLWRGLPGTNGTNGTIGKDGKDGKDGVSFQYIGQFATVGELPANPAVSQSATVGTSPTDLYLSHSGTWINVGPVGQKGDIGETGLTGAIGKSAYEVAVEAGFGGSQVQWIASLKGLTGQSAFELAVAAGFVGDQAAWIASLHGVNGKSAYQLALDEGFVGDQTAWVASLTGKGLAFIGDYADSANFPAGALSQVATAAGHVFMHNGTTWVDVGPIATGPKGDTGSKGDDGKTAYELAVAGGFQGDLAAWLVSLKGTTGTTGKSTYQEAVDSGLFSGTFGEFVDSQKGAPGVSAYEEALANGTVPPETTFLQFLDTIKGPEGPKGGTGDTGPAIRIIGTVVNAGALPAVGVEGTGYAIADSASPGTFNCYIWLSSTSQWFNLGHVVGATGLKGDTGDRGLQGLRGAVGEKGDVGSIWIVLARDPLALDGRIGDYFLNSASQEYFRKTGAAVWASLGFMGGGNLYKPNSDGKTKGMKDGLWVDLGLIDSIPVSETETYQLVNGQWKKFDTYTLKAVVATNTVDFNAARVFRIDNTAAATVALTNVPDADHATTVVVKVYGKVGAFQWTLPAGKGTLRWFDGAAPVFANDVTTIIFTWDGREMTGSVPN